MPIRIMSACDRLSQAIPVVTDKVINQLVEMKSLTLHCVSSQIVQTLIFLPNYRRKVIGVPYDPLVEPVPIVRNSKSPGPTSPRNNARFCRLGSSSTCSIHIQRHTK